jgi:hypothetical protein
VTFQAKLLTSAIAELQEAQKAEHRAYAHNFHFEERLTAGRREKYEEALALRGSSLKVLNKAHVDFISKHINVAALSDISDPFDHVNQDATIAPLQPTQRLARIEDLSGWMDSGVFPKDGGALARTVRVARNGSSESGDPAKAEAEDALSAYVGIWNAKRDGRPGFAALYDEVRDDLGSDDWAERLRDQLGLGHLTGSEAEPRPVALMIYTVSDVLKPLAATPDQKSYAFCAPTVIDSRFNEYFFPSPRPKAAIDISYGRTVDLASVVPERKLVCEMLHRPFRYRQEHIARIGWIRSGLPNNEIWDLRNAHLRRLRGETGRDSFGAEMKPDERA